MVEELLHRFRTEVEKQFYPFLILTILDEQGQATKRQIKAEVAKRSGGAFDSSGGSFDRLMSRMHKTFGLIEPVGKDASEALFALTDQGAELHAAAREQVIDPLLKCLPWE